MKKFFALLLAALLLLSCTACTSAKIEDTNGPDNFELNTITDQNILKLDLPSSGHGYKTGGLLAKTIEFSSKDFSGVVEILWTDMIAGTFVLDFIEYNVTGGNFRMVIVNNDRIVDEIAPGTTRVELSDLEGYVSLRIAGESAAYSFSMFQSEYDTFAHH